MKKFGLIVGLGSGLLLLLFLGICVARSVPEDRIEAEAKYVRTEHGKRTVLFFTEQARYPEAIVRQYDAWLAKQDMRGIISVSHSVSPNTRRGEGGYTVSILVTFLEP